jgi:hypothetical protein
MTYDRDILRMRRLLAGLIVLNVGVGLMDLYHHDWLGLLAWIVFTCNILALRAGLAASQKTRDEVRLLASVALHTLPEDR